MKGDLELLSYFLISCEVCVVSGMDAVGILG